MKIYSLYFSPTGNTKKAACAISDVISTEFCAEVTEIDYSRLENRQKNYDFGKDDVVVLAMPTYAGRIPNKVLPDLQQGIHGNDTPAISIVTYGNRSADESLRELTMLAKDHGFLPLAAAACVSEHTFSKKLAAGRPDENDLVQLKEFAKKCADKIKEKSYGIEGMDLDTPIGPYYTPRKEDGSPAKFLKAKPLTDESLCDRCGACIQVCPMNSIDPSDCTKVPGICIKCNACVHICPTHAKHFEDEAFLSHIRMLEKNYTARKESEFYL